MRIVDKVKSWLQPLDPDMPRGDEPVDPERAAHAAIDRDQVRIGEFGGHIADVIQEIKRLEGDRTPLQAEVDKWERLKAFAASAGNEDGVRQAVEQKVLIQRRVDAVDTQLAEARSLKSELEQSYQEAQDRVAAASGKVPLLSAKQAGAEMREHLAKADVDGRASDSAEGAVAALEDHVMERGAHAAAYEEMASGTTAAAGRIAESTVDPGAVDAEVRAAMEAAGRG